MKISSGQYERILKFLDGDMTVEEMNAFAKELAANPEMQSQIDFEQSVRDALAVNDTENGKDNNEEENIQNEIAFGIRRQIEKVREQWTALNKKKQPILLEPAKQSKKTNVIPFRNLTAIAVACVVIVAAGVVWFIVNRHTGSLVVNSRRVNSPKQDSQVQDEVNRAADSLNIIKSPGTKPDLASLYKQYFKKDTAPQVKPMMLAEALIDYENNSYKSLQNLELTNLPTDRGVSSSNINSNQNIKELGHYYKGLAYIEIKDDIQAMENLQWAIDSAQHKQLHVKAEWYMALVQLRTGNVSKTVTLLAGVSESNISPYNTQAKKLLLALNRNGK